MRPPRTSTSGRPSADVLVGEVMTRGATGAGVTVNPARSVATEPDPLVNTARNQWALSAGVATPVYVVLVAPAMFE